MQFVILILFLFTPLASSFIFSRIPNPHAFIQAPNDVLRSWALSKSTKLGSSNENDSSSLDFSDLQARVNAMRSQAPTLSSTPPPSRCYCVLFNPDTDSEGIHTVNLNGIDILLAFVSRMDCSRFALSLEAQGFYTPVATELAFTDIEQFVESSKGVEYQIVPEGTVLTPPENNVEDIEFEQKESGECVSSTSDVNSLRMEMEKSFRIMIDENDESSDFL